MGGAGDGWTDGRTDREPTSPEDDGNRGLLADTDNEATMKDEQMPFSHHKEFNRGFSSRCNVLKQENSGEEPTVKGQGGALEPLWQLS